MRNVIKFYDQPVNVDPVVSTVNKIQVSTEIFTKINPLGNTVNANMLTRVRSSLLMERRPATIRQLILVNIVLNPTVLPNLLFGP